MISIIGQEWTFLFCSCMPIGFDRCPNCKAHACPDSIHASGTQQQHYYYLLAADAETASEKTAKGPLDSAGARLLHRSSCVHSLKLQSSFYITIYLYKIENNVLQIEHQNVWWLVVQRRRWYNEMWVCEMLPHVTVLVFWQMITTSFHLHLLLLMLNVGNSVILQGEKIVPWTSANSCQLYHTSASCLEKFKESQMIMIRSHWQTFLELSKSGIRL